MDSEGEPRASHLFHGRQERWPAHSSQPLVWRQDDLIQAEDRVSHLQNRAESWRTAARVSQRDRDRARSKRYTLYAGAPRLVERLLLSVDERYALRPIRPKLPSDREAKLADCLGVPAIAVLLRRPLGLQEIRNQAGRHRGRRRSKQDQTRKVLPDGPKRSKQRRRRCTKGINKRVLLCVE